MNRSKHMPNGFLQRTVRRGLSTLLTLATLGLGAGSTLTACRNEPYCLNCVDGAAVSDVVNFEIAQRDTVVDTGSSDVVVAPDIVQPDGCTPGAEELCNNADDNCDGRTDEDFNTQTDPRNCGSCGQACALAHAIPSCAAGRCVIPPGGCDTNFYDLNGDPADGCEYGCTPVPGATDDSTCDNRDDDCDGVRDEDVNRCTDARNCGACGNVCNLPHATAGCARIDPAGTDACSTTNTHCVVSSCADNFYDLNNDPTDGCEYACTPTGAEICNGLDDNCDGTVDEGNPGGGAACGTNVGECSQGTMQCVSGALSCQGAVEPAAETCDALDNDCNGNTDDGLLTADARIGVACGSGVGDCRPGRTTCVSGAPTCTGATVATPETCDGRDNDCDGSIDNGVAAGGSCGGALPPNGPDTGECSQGTLQCIGGAMRCMGATGPGTETCDTLDNDCDGQTDNGFDFQNDPNHCGNCATSCAALPHAATSCRSGACALLACAPGFFNLNNDLTDGCEYACNYLGPSELCNGLDDDCDGSTDESLTVPTGLCRTVGACSGATASCGGAAGWRCSYNANVEVDSTTGQPVAIETRCDSIDGNCNGATDESFSNLGQSCNNLGVGACRTTGTFVCNAARTATSCNAPAAPPAGTETCNGIDDDCDGSTDETRAVPGTNPSFVSTSWVSYTNNRWIMQYEASRPGASASAQGTASNRACSVGGVLPWTNLTYSQAAAACTAAGATLCAETDWLRACRSTTNTCTWSYSSTCTTYSSGRCNDINNDIDTGTAGVQNGLLATGAETNCLSDFGATDIFDMSGNVKEFTTSRGTNQNPLRGGAYNNLANGTACAFDWTVVDDRFAFVNAGFRCCYSGTTAP